MEHCLTQLVKQGRPFKYIGDSTSHLLKNNNVVPHIGMEHLFVNVCLPMFCSKLHNHAEEWCRSPHSQLLLLGHQYWWWEGISIVYISIKCLLSDIKNVLFVYYNYQPSSSRDAIPLVFLSFSILILLHLFTALTISVKCFFLLSLLVYLMCEIILFQEAARSGGRIAPCTVLSVCLLLPWQYDDWWCAALTPSHMIHPNILK